jgi:hypothetical protein
MMVLTRPICFGFLYSMQNRDDPNAPTANLVMKQLMYVAVFHHFTCALVISRGSFATTNRLHGINCPYQT